MTVEGILVLALIAWILFRPRSSSTEGSTSHTNRKSLYGNTSRINTSTVAAGVIPSLALSSTIIDNDDSCSQSTFSDSHSDFLNNDHISSDIYTVTNPATGLPMVGGMGGIDVAGNCYGCNDSFDSPGFDLTSSISSSNSLDICSSSDSFDSFSNQDSFDSFSSNDSFSNFD